MTSTFVGDGARTLLVRALRVCGAEVEASDPVVERALVAFDAHYLANPARASQVMPGALEALDALDGRTLAVATNKRRLTAEAVLTAMGLRARFAHVWGGGDGPLKPDPSSIHTLRERVGCAMEDVWMVGDGPQDVGAGKAAGARTVAVLGGFHPEERVRASGPDFVIRSLAELVAIVGSGR
jgi:phosphoglycolate phosphatase